MSLFAPMGRRDKDVPSLPVGSEEESHAAGPRHDVRGAEHRACRSETGVPGRRRHHGAGPTRRTAFSQQTPPTQCAQWTGPERGWRYAIPFGVCATWRNSRGSFARCAGDAGVNTGAPAGGCRWMGYRGRDVVASRPVTSDRRRCARRLFLAFRRDPSGPARTAAAPVRAHPRGRLRPGLRVRGHGRGNGRGVRRSSRLREPVGPRGHRRRPRLRAPATARRPRRGARRRRHHRVHRHRHRRGAPGLRGQDHLPGLPVRRRTGDRRGGRLPRHRGGERRRGRQHGWRVFLPRSRLGRGPRHVGDPARVGRRSLRADHAGASERV